MSEEKPHPITLGNFFFTKNLVESVPDHEPTGEKLAVHPDNNLVVNKLPDEPGAWVATMSSVFNPEMDKVAPYHFDIHCMAVFHADDTLTEQEAQRGVTITANSVLYGAIRESVAWLTGRQPYGPMVLGLSVLRGPPKKEAEQIQKA